MSGREPTTAEGKLAAVLECAGVRVVFRREGDRFTHRIEVRRSPADDWRVACETAEGSPNDDWPSSPPFQQLHVERRPTGPVVLLVGMAGRTHWSGAAEIAADGAGIRFDLAARSSEPPRCLGVRYVSVDADACGRLAWSPHGDTECEISEKPGDGRTLRPRGPLQLPPATWTWKYVVGCRAGA